MEHGVGAGSGVTQVITQMLVFLAATCVVIPALRRARLSAAMGFLLIGVAMGPQVLGRLAQTWPWLSAFDLEESARTLLLGQLGVIFLLFIIGLEVSFERLWRIRRYVFGLGPAQMKPSAAAIAGAALAFGAPARLRGAELDAYLDHLGGRRRFTDLAAAAEAAGDRHALLAAAQALYDWKKEKGR